MSNNKEIKELEDFRDRVNATISKIYSLSRRKSDLTKEWTERVIKGFRETIEITNRKVK